MAGTLAAVLLCSLTAAAATLQPPRWPIGAGGYPRGLELGGNNSHGDDGDRDGNDGGNGGGGTMLVCAGGGAAGMAVYRGQRDAGPGGGWTGWAKIGVVQADPDPGTDISNCVLQLLAGTGEMLAAYRVREHARIGPHSPAVREPTRIRAVPILSPAARAQRQGRSRGCPGCARSCGVVHTVSCCIPRSTPSASLIPRPLTRAQHHTGCGPDATAGATGYGGRLPALCTK